MMPDAEYYLRMRMYGTWGHEWPGVLVYNLLIGLICTFLFHSIIKRPLIDHLPIYLKVKYLDAYQFDWKAYFKLNWLNVVLSIYLGIITHLFWDVFTHEPGYIFGVNISWLATMAGNYPIHSWLQLVLSIFGVGMLSLMIILPKIDTSSDEMNNKTSRTSWFWFVLIVLFISIYTIRFWIGIPTEKYWIQHMVIATSSFLLSLLLVSLFIKVFRRFDIFSKSDLLDN